jgi:hypothetical protein
MRVNRLIIVPVLAMAAVAMLAQSPTQFPLDPTHESGQSITGAFEGWFPNSDGSFSLLVGYFNRNSKETIEIPIGPNNHIDPGGPDMGQPTTFLPRRQWGVFTIKVPKDFGDKRLTWTITANGQTTTIPLDVNPLWVVTPYKDAGIGNTPPVLKFEEGGQSFTGPPIGIAKTFNTKAKESLPLTVWISDDMVRPPESGARGGRGLAVSWSKYRGPGAVTFANARPAVETDGKSSTSATFASPGEYILRGQANDATGEGGGGFQCCWTNVHVKVTVAAGTSNQ